ncbi:MAG TPA: hypothetical protein VF101_19385 [Gaiellaceae bacterium]
MTSTVARTPRAAEGLEAPFKGLTNFEEADWAIFFGRDRERELIALKLLASRFTVVYGESGVGKSSLLRAGVVHDLQKRALAETSERRPKGSRLGPPFIPVVFDDWKDDPIPRLDDSIRRAAEPLVDGPLPAPFAGGSLDELVEHWNKATGATLLIVFDQFEEYLLYHAAGIEAFDAGLARAVTRRELNVRFLVSIREDAVAKLDRFEQRIPRLLDTMIRIEHLGVGEAEKAIRGPIATYNRAVAPDKRVEIEGKLVKAVLEQVQTGAVATNGRRPSNGDRASGGGRIETTFLQLVMERLWHEEAADGCYVLRLKTLKALGGAQTIVLKHLTDAMDALTPDQQDVASRIFRDLVTPSRQKIAQLPSDLARMHRGLDDEQVRSVLERLATGRIVKPTSPPPGGTESRFEIFHDKLADPILAWRSGHLQRRHEREADERARQARRRARLWRTGAAAALAVAVGCGVLLVLTFEAKRTADAAKRDARSQKLVAQSGADLAVDPAEAVALADRALDVKATPEAETAFRRAVGLSPLRVVIHHGGDVSHAEYSADGSRVLAVGAEGTASVSDARTGRRLTTIKYGKALLTGGFSKDGKRVMTVGADDTVRFWNADTGAQLASFRNPQVNGAWLDPADGRAVLATGWDGRVRIWRLGLQRPLVVGRPTTHPLLHAAFSPDGSKAVVIGTDPTAWILDARTGHVLRELRGHTASINAAAWSPNGRLVATGGDDATAYVWDAASGKPAIPAISEPNAVGALAFNADGTKLATAAGTRVLVFSTSSGRQLAELRGHSDVINDVEFRKQGEVLVTASNDGTARVWDYAEFSETTLRTLLGDRSVVETAVFSPDGRSVLTGSADGTARIWDVGTGRELWRHFGWVLDAAFSPDGKWILTAGRDYQIALWNGHTGRFVRALPAPPSSAVDSIRFSADGKLVAIAEYGGVVTVRDTTTWLPIARIDVDPAPVAEAVFSPDGARIATASVDGWAGIFDSRSGERIRWLHAKRNEAAHPLGSATGVAWSSDGRFIATTSSDSTVHVWNPRSGKLLRTLWGHAGRVVSPAFRPGSDLLVTAGVDRTARVWNVATAKQVALLADDPQALSTTAFSPDGQRVVTGDAGGTAQVWDWRREQLLGTLPTHSDYINAVSFSPDGKRILSASNDATAKIYGCETCVSLTQLRELVARRNRVLNADGG